MNSSNNIVIKVENLSKQYRLGLVGTGTLSDDLNRWWAKFRGKDDPMLKVGEVNKRDKYASGGQNAYVWALKDVNFEVGQGDVLGIIGKNGAGKSTLLKILSRVTGPTTGSVKAKGRIASLLEVGTGFHPELTGKENIFLNGAILGMTKTEISSKLDEIIEFSGVERYIDTPVKRYSSGMYVRLAFAVAAHLDPEILIIDEVLAVGDIEFQKKCLGKMKDIAGQGRTVLFVSHNMSAVQNLCDRVMLLENGQPVEIGKTSAMIKRYMSEANQHLQNDSQNFFKHVTRRGEGKVIFEDIQVVNSKGEINTFEAEEGTDIEFRITIKVKVHTENVRCAVALRSSSYNEFITNSERFDLNLEKADKNTKTLSFSIYFRDLKLRTGIYNLYFWLGTGQSKGRLDIIDSEIPPLVIMSDKNNEEIGTKDPGFFSIRSELKYS